MAYNATVYETKGKENWGVFVAEVMELNGRPQMIRGNGVQCTGYEGRTITADIPELDASAGDAAYDVYLRAMNQDSEYRIVEDNCAGYKHELTGLVG